MRYTELELLGIQHILKSCVQMKEVIIEQEMTGEAVDQSLVKNIARNHQALLIMMPELKKVFLGEEDGFHFDVRDVLEDQPLSEILKKLR